MFANSYPSERITTDNIAKKKHFYYEVMVNINRI